MDVSHQSAAKGMMGCSFPFLFRFQASPAAAAALVKKVDGDDDAPELCAAVASSSSSSPSSVSGGALNALHDAGISGGGVATEQAVLSPQMQTQMQTHMSEPPLVERGGLVSAVTTTTCGEEDGGPVFGTGAVGVGAVDTMERTSSSLFNALGCDEEHRGCLCIKPVSHVP